ncbi:hypothetical protein HID58_093909 [Brassica napus]|uniref:Uncharacterized protein n=1 Tax=Brassica napus TaxID=3708 RepID=A0ABQ7X9I1_BRANA|nr:hypothetical protein HID58_093909 [Brassica napus]
MNTVVISDEHEALILQCHLGMISLALISRPLLPSLLLLLLP